MSPILTTLVTAAGLVLAGQALANGPCGGTVTFGEGDTRIVTSVPNRPAGGSCFNDRIVDTGAEGANYGNHGEFVREVGKLAGGWLRERRIGARQFSELITAAARSDVGRTLKLRIIAFNDFHGYIDGSNLSLRSDPDNLFLLNAQGQRTGVPAGGVDYMAGLVEQLRSGAPNSVVVSAGDLIGASPLNSALFHDEPAIETMNRLGLEFNAVGNHEFDEGREELLRMKHGGCHPTDPNSCRGDSVGHALPVRGRQIRLPRRQRGGYRLGQDAVPGVRREGLQRQPRRLHRHDAQGHSHHRHARRRGRAGVSRRGGDGERSGGQAQASRHRRGGGPAP